MMIVRGFWRENSSAQIDRILQSNRENHEHQKIFLEYIVMQKIKPIRHEKLNLQPRTYILIHCGFVASSCVLIFAVIGCNTINILEIFQVFSVFASLIAFQQAMRGEHAQGRGGTSNEDPISFQFANNYVL